MVKMLRILLSLPFVVLRTIDVITVYITVKKKFEFFFVKLVDSLRSHSHSSNGIQITIGLVFFFFMNTK